MIAGGVTKYSEFYMEGEKNYMRFVLVLAIFVFSILIMIVRPNLGSLLLGWDGLGLRSYILVIFYQRESSCNAGMLTVLRNRVGDVAILIRLGLLSFKGGFNFLFISSLD